MARGTSEARFTANIDDFSKKLARMNNQLTQFATGGTKNLGSLEGAFGALTGKGTSSMGQLIGSVGKLAGAFGLATSAVSLLKSNIETAKEFEKSLSNLKAITNADVESMEYFKQAAIELGGSTTQTASQVAEAFKMIGAQKPELLGNKEALVDLTKQAIILAQAAGMEVPESARALTTALNMMGEGADQAERYINVLAAGSRNGTMGIEGLTEVLFRAGQAAHIGGVSIEELVGFTETIAPAFGSAEVAGQALNKFFMKLETGTNDQFKPSVVGFTQALENLRAADLSTAEANKLLTANGFKVYAAFMQASSGAQTMIEKVTGTSTAYEQSEINTNNLAGSLDKLSSAWEQFNLTLNSSNGFLKTWIDNITNSLSLINAFMSAGGDMEMMRALAVAANDTQKLTEEQKAWAAEVKRGVMGMDEFSSKSFKAIQNVKGVIGEIERTGKMTLSDGTVLDLTPEQQKKVVAQYEALLTKLRDERDVVMGRKAPVVSAPTPAKPKNGGSVLGFNIDELDRATTRDITKLEAKVKELRNLLVKTDDVSLQKGYETQIDAIMAKIDELKAKLKSLVDENGDLRMEARMDFYISGDPMEIANQGVDARVAKSANMEMPGPVDEDAIDWEIAIDTRDAEERLSALREEIKTLDSEQTEAVKNLAGSFVELGDTIAGLGDAFDNCTTVWDYFSTAVKEGLTIMDEVQRVMEVINTLTSLSSTLKAKDTAMTQMSTSASGQNAAAKGTEAAAAIADANAQTVDASSKAMNAHSWIPYVGVAIGAAMIATMIATLFSLPKFAEGGIMGGHTTEGDRLLARINEGEMVLNRRQQGSLSRMIEAGGSAGDGGRGGEIRVRIENDELTGTLRNAGVRGGYVRG